VTGEEFILLKSCIRLILVECMSEFSSDEEDFPNGKNLMAEDICAIIQNEAAGVFGGEANNDCRAKYSGDDKTEKIIDGLNNLLKRLRDCEKSFQGYMLV
tara:strand:+ start:1285 stop:1584 length:300 start_codon:yes stop_codon:yes gene_type:complete